MLPNEPPPTGPADDPGRLDWRNRPAAELGLPLLTRILWEMQQAGELPSPPPAPEPDRGWHQEPLWPRA